MEYRKTVSLKDGRLCVIRNGAGADAVAVLDVFIRTHEQTGYLLSYPDEITFTAEKEKEFLKKKTESEREAELVAQVDGAIVGTAGIEPVGKAEKVRHRASFGVGIDEDFWSLGVGRALTEACVSCAVRAGYSQLELEVLSDNRRAIGLYRSLGFTEYGRNPEGIRTREGVFRETILMRLSLNAPQAQSPNPIQF